MNRRAPLVVLAAAALSTTAFAQSEPAGPRRAPAHVDRPVTPRTFDERPVAARPPADDEALAQRLLTAVSEVDRFENVHHDLAMDGSLWARGRDYKASVGPSGFTFIPFLGSDAPRNYPVSFQLSSVRRGGHELELSGEPEFDRAGDRWTIDRGSVEVRYDLSSDGAEQSFLLDVPSGTGDLVLSLRIDTELTLSRHGDGYRFANERGGVDYGAAVVIDADGDRSDVRTRRTGDGLELVVPGDFVDDATGPILVDPLLTAFAIDEYTLDLWRPDLAYDEVDRKYCIV